MRLCEQWIGTCRYLDEYLTEINGECFHICQFAEIQERIGSAAEPEAAPENVHGYIINARTFVGNKIFNFGHNPNAVQPYVTWRSYKDNPGRNDWGHYWSDKSTARTDFFLRADRQRTGKSYNRTMLIKKRSDRER